MKSLPVPSLALSCERARLFLHVQGVVSVSQPLLWEEDMRSYGLECRSVRPLLALHPDDWSEEERCLVESHLAGCSECSELLRTFTEHARLIRAALRRDIVPLDPGLLGFRYGPHSLN